MDIIQYIQDQYSSSQIWAQDPRLGKITRHITFAEFPPAGRAFCTVLDDYYETHGIAAWDFVHPHDNTTLLHIPFFKNWRGHRYAIPPDAFSGFHVEFGPRRHGMEGYMKAVQWMMENETVLRSVYSY
jgi:hypothetical protein